MSGAPLKARALEVLRRLHAQTGDRLVLIAAGGIETADDAWDRLAAGATLVQAYTAFIYEGPLWPHRSRQALARRAREAPDQPRQLTSDHDREDLCLIAKAFWFAWNDFVAFSKNVFAILVERVNLWGDWCW